jgi:thiamine-phosphate pyrophosphorylase
MFHENIYHFIDDFDKNKILSLDKKIKLIYRDYSKKTSYKTIKELSVFCKNHNRQLFISNNLKLALKCNLNGIYIPSFNNKNNFKNISYKKNFLIIGSAHNIREIKIKEKQGCRQIFLSPIFYNPKNKKYLDVIKFNLLTLTTKIPIIALGGVNDLNIRKLNLTKVIGFGAINLFKKKAPS